MKRKNILIILVVFCFFLIGVVVYLKINDNNSNTKNDDTVNNSTNKSSDIEKETTVLTKDTNAFELYSKLAGYGKEIYDSKKYEKYDKVDDAYFISLKSLKEDFDYDISMFKDEEGTLCDEEKSGIFFDVDHKSGVSFADGVDPILTTLVGCELIMESENK